MKKNLPSPILITGAARSGTSMVAGVINMCGAFGGVMAGPNKNNQKGMFENVRVRNEVVKPYLKAVGVDPMGQFPLSDVDNLMIPRDIQQRVEQVMIEEGYSGGLWMYKGAKMCLSWPVWHYAFPNARWIIVRRKTEDIVHSCVRTGFMRAWYNLNNLKAIGANSEEEGWTWWVEQHEKRFNEMINEGLNCKVVWPDRMVTGDYKQLYETLEWLGLKWDSEVLSFIDPLLFHSRKKQENKTV